MPAKCTSGFPRPGTYCLLPQARSTLRCSVSRMKGELHPPENRSRGGLPRIWIDTVELNIRFPVWPLLETAVGVLCNCALSYTHRCIRESSSEQLRFFTRTNDISTPGHREHCSRSNLKNGTPSVVWITQVIGGRFTTFLPTGTNPIYNRYMLIHFV